MTNVQYDDNIVVRPHAHFLLSGTQSGGHYDDDEDDEDSQTDGDPDLLLHQNKQNFLLAHKINTYFC